MAVSTNSTIISSKNPANFEDQITFTVTVTGSSFNVAPPSGTVNFFDGIALIGSATLTPNGPLSTISTASLDVTILLVGSHSISALYVGDANYIGSTATPDPLNQQVNAVANSASIVPGFGLVASFQSTGDSSLPPQALLYAVPALGPPSEQITLLWDTLNVGQIVISGNNGVDPPFRFPAVGQVSTTGSGVYIVPNGFTKTILLTLTAYDATGHPLGLTSTTQVTIT